MIRHPVLWGALGGTLFAACYGTPEHARPIAALLDTSGRTATLIVVAFHVALLVLAYAWDRVADALADRREARRLLAGLGLPPDY